MNTFRKGKTGNSGNLVTGHASDNQMEQFESLMYLNSLSYVSTAAVHRLW